MDSRVGNGHALLRGDLSELGQLYASDEYRCPFVKKVIFQVNHWNIARALAKKGFQLKHKISNRLFNLSGVRAPVGVASPESSLATSGGCGPYLEPSLMPRCRPAWMARR